MHNANINFDAHQSGAATKFSTTSRRQSFLNRVIKLLAIVTILLLNNDIAQAQVISNYTSGARAQINLGMLGNDQSHHNFGFASEIESHLDLGNVTNTSAQVVFEYKIEAQAQVISGNVRDAQTRQPLEGAAIVVTSSGQGTTSDIRGNFSLNTTIPRGETAELRITFLGYKEDRIVVTSGRTTDISVNLIPETIISDAIFVMGHRVDDNTPVTYTNISNDDIKRQNTGRDVPFIIQNTPSVVSTSDAGTGVGYTGLRIRGVDDTRINVTINGIPLNDSESHGVFWVNMPDFSSSVGSMQIQRGVGTSTNGPAAFGATLNLQTSALNTEPNAMVSSTVGSFNTYRNSIQVGTGLFENGWALEGRLSSIQSDGFIDRATADLSSWYVSASRYGTRDLLKINVFSGSERTYQAWNGIPEARLRNDVAGMNNYADEHGLSQEERDRLLNSNSRTYNMFTYENQVDNYSQTHYQLHYSYRLADNWYLNSALHYTRGEGYFEEYRENDRLSTYNLPSFQVGGATISRSDVVRRRWLDNHFYGAVVSTELDLTETVQLTAGGGYNIYDGDHYGELIWARNAGTAEIGHRYYDNNGTKRDGNAYLKANISLSEHLSVYGDVQMRNINYAFLGLELDANQNPINVDQEVNLTFFNPKAGLVYRIADGSRAYISYSVANKEPVRREYTRSTPETRPSPERLYDLEAGFRLDRAQWYGGVNFYYMNYDNQLILTGQVNDVGAAIRTNVKESYRAGIELEGAFEPIRGTQLLGNLTFSRNRIPEFSEFIDTFDENYASVAQTEVVYTDTPISFAPDVIGSATVRQHVRGLSLDFVSKYVSRQYLDNSGLTSRSIDPYFTNDLLLRYTFNDVQFVKDISVNLHIINLFDVKYETNGYTYAWIFDGSENRFNFYYPQAGRHGMLQVLFNF